MPGLLRGVARTAVVAGTATAVSNRVSRRQANRWAAQQPQQPQYDQQQQYPQQDPYGAPAQRYESQPYAAPEAPEPDMDTKLAQLKELGALKEQGVLTGAEFEAQKAAILGR